MIEHTFPVTLPKPHTEPRGMTQSGPSAVLANAYGEKGVRKQMEDEHLICLSLRSVAPHLTLQKDYALFAVMDGHGGRQCAAFVKECLPTEIAGQLSALPEDTPLPLSDRLMKNVINGAFSKIDSRIATEIPSCKDGCTVVIVLIQGSSVYIASLGDSAGFLCRKKSDGLHAIPLTEAHKPWVIKEKDRILKFGGTIENGRVNGILEVTRSFGDISLKKYGILCTPTFRKFIIDAQNDQFILLGCDGLWSYITAVDIVGKASDLCTKEHRRTYLEADNSYFDVKNVCKQLVEHIIVDKKSQDNVSALMIYFPK